MRPVAAGKSHQSVPGDTFVTTVPLSASPQGSVYQKTNAMSEIKRVNKDNFWAKAEVGPAAAFQHEEDAAFGCTCGLFSVRTSPL